MNTETWEMVLKAEDTKKQVLGITAYTGGIRLQQSQVTEYLRGYGTVSYTHLIEMSRTADRLEKSDTCL